MKPSLQLSSYILCMVLSLIAPFALAQQVNSNSIRAIPNPRTAPSRNQMLARSQMRIPANMIENPQLGPDERCAQITQLFADVQTECARSREQVQRLEEQGRRLRTIQSATARDHQTNRRYLTQANNRWEICAFKQQELKNLASEWQRRYPECASRLRQEGGSDSSDSPSDVQSI